MSGGGPPGRVRGRAPAWPSWLAAALLGVAGLAAPASGLAVGLGEIAVHSALNERLDARVPLRGLAAGEIDGLEVGLAPDDAFARAGLDRSRVPARLTFTPRAGSIRITSRDRIREPTFSFVLQVASRGRIVQRRYDVVLNLQ